MLTINKGIQQSAVKVVVYGVEGIGKTTFASHFPAPLFLDLDRGSRRMDVDRIDSIQDWPALMGTLDQIQRDPSLPYSTIVIDTADMAAKLASAFICTGQARKRPKRPFLYTSLRPQFGQTSSDSSSGTLRCLPSSWISALLRFASKSL